MDQSGAAFIEFTAVVPLVLLFTFGVIDMGLLFFDWAQANRATYGATRMATVTNPIATGIDANISGSTAGQSCVDPATGNATGNCTARATATCVALDSTAATIDCGTYSYNSGAFVAILAEFQRLYPTRTIDARQIQITYEPLPLGYVSRPSGPPMNITVSIKCMTHEFFFIAAIASWAFPPLPQSCSGVPARPGIKMPAFATTLPSEDLQTNNF